MADPISFQLADTLPAFLKRYQEEAPLAALVGMENYAPIAQLNLNAARRGANLSKQSLTVPLLKAIISGQRQAKKDEPSMWERAVGDIGTIVKAVPQMPAMLAKEAWSIKDLPRELSEAATSGDLSKIAEVPGIRLLPGAYIAAEGREALKHPVFAALDIAPYAKWATKGAQLPKFAGGKFIEGGVPRAARQIRKTERGADILNTFDRARMRLPIAREARGTARISARANRQLAYDAEQAYRAIGDTKRRLNISDEDEVRLHQMGVENPQFRALLEPNEKEFLDFVETENRRLGDQWVDKGLLGKINDEFYPIAQYDTLQKLEKQYWKAIQNENPGAATRALEAWEKKFQTTPPMRFNPALRRHYQNKLIEAMQKKADPHLWQAYEDLIREDMWDKVPVFEKKELTKLRKEIAPRWEAMKAQGLNPVFMHTVRSDQIKYLERPSVYPGAQYKPGVVKPGKWWNPTPGYQSFSVALGHAEFEWLRHNAAEEVISVIENTYGKRRSVVEAGYDRSARRLEAGEPGLTLPGALQQQMQKDWISWEPNTIFPWRPTRRLPSGKDEIMVPKQVANQIQEIYKSHDAGFRGAWDKTMKVYRTGILPLSPRWHIYNAIGGAILLGARGDPRMLRHIFAARKMVKDNVLPNELSRGMVQIPEEVRLVQWQKGKKLAQMVKEGKYLEAAKAGPRRGLNKAWDWAENVDSFYRSLAYLHGAKDVAKGMSKEASHAAGINLANKVLQDWDAMVPFERSVIRSIFPFYGWMKHIAKYVTTYPWDHPLRASIMSNFVRNEIEDWQTGLPEDFQNYLYFGPTDDMGNQQGLNLRGANPFSDVANLFTLNGFISQMNPIAGGLAEASGIDQLSGRADLFPDTEFDPNTGRLVGTQPSLPSAILGLHKEFFPQLRFARHAMGIPDKEMQELKQSRPDVYQQTLWSSMGVPAPRKINKKLEIARSELRAQEDMQTAWTEALKSGDWSSAAQYPSLRPLIEIVAPLRQQISDLGIYNTQPPPAGVTLR